MKRTLVMMNMTRLALALALVAVLGCKKDDAAQPAKPAEPAAQPAKPAEPAEPLD